MDRVNTVKSILWIITGVAAAVAITRFMFGLGATTNLSDATPWGLWIGFDVMGGVALAAGGFVITAIVYIMKREEFRPIVKPAVLTAFLGYLAVIASLLVDLGLPWNIWHMMIYWNPHSALFEVGWCVMLYTTVLMLEFSPVPLEKTSRYARVRGFLMSIRLPLVLLGIMFSTLHQSSLGSLFLIMPFKLYPLWYSSILPVMFFISAVALGLAMVSLESLVTTYLYRRKPESDLIAKLLGAARWVLVLYLAVRFSDIAVAGNLDKILAGTWESFLFICEILIVAVVPIILFSISSVRKSVAGQWIGSSMVVFGVVFNRINIGGVTMMGATGEVYLPSWMEIVVTAGVISGAMLVFLFAIEKLRIWERPPQDPEAEPYRLPAFSRNAEVWLGTPAVSARIRYSMFFILAFAVALALIPGKRIHSEGVAELPVQAARGGDTLFVDGNRDGYGVSFTHRLHVDTLGGDQSCSGCHHMNLPGDRQTGCYNCHSGMYTASAVFDHDWHSGAYGAKLSCSQCHTKGEERTKLTAKKCKSCHIDLIPANSTIKIEQYMAPSYVDAMHGNCITCHRRKTEELAATDQKKDLALCVTCHESVSPEYLTPEIAEAVRSKKQGSVVIPGLTLEGKR